MRSILKLARHNTEKEIDFELKYLRSLSVKKRFEMMFKKTKEIVKLLERHGHRKPFEIIKRT
ncbi:MAG: hypothetical protein AUJ70_04195 [Candidatus Omnitrophica bacterium CG1_02_40_15]|jgi:hypothetical protein|nr:MAG: hypothetical protein AUJ70_04195 [Candidatus Omnitrophica bacterium CG1_02_40_15]